MILMKANEQITMPNLKGFEDGKLKEGQSSYFYIEEGEDVAEVLKKHDYSDVEVAEYQTRILKGNPQWVRLETSKETQKLTEVKEAKAKEEKRKEELFKLSKKEQTALLKGLGVEVVPGTEVDRVALIMELEGKQ